MGEFLQMGGYAAFVWPAYGISLAVLGVVTVWTIVAERKLRRQLDAIEGRRS